MGYAHLLLRDPGVGGAITSAGGFRPWGPLGMGLGWHAHQLRGKVGAVLPIHDSRRGRFNLGGKESEGGFYTTKWCWARSQNSAAERAMQLVRDDWETGESARLRCGDIPSLSIETGRRIRFFEIWAAPNRGHTFYDADDGSGAENDDDKVRYCVLE
jgi:hypothetical protein